MRVKTGTNDADLTKRTLRLAHQGACAQFDVLPTEALAIEAKFDFWLLPDTHNGYLKRLEH